MYIKAFISERNVPATQFSRKSRQQEHLQISRHDGVSVEQILSVLQQSDCAFQHSTRTLRKPSVESLSETENNIRYIWIELCLPMEPDHYYFRTGPLQNFNTPRSIRMV